jgi:cell division ATPase FtsA
MAKLYKVGDYGEMKLGEFRKNIMQYTRNNLRSIIRDSDPEIVEIAQDELDRRGEERKKGGLIDKPLGPGGKKKKKKGKK